MRWIAAAVALGLITIARPPSSKPLLVWWVGLVIANFAFESVAHRFKQYDRQLVIQAVVDLWILAGFLNASGGLENPLYTVFLLHVIVGHLLLGPRRASVLTVVAGLLFGLLAFGEYFQFLPHYTNFIFPHGLAVEHVGESPELVAHVVTTHASHDLFFVLGRAIPFLLVLLLTDRFMATMMEKLGEGERDLEASVKNARFERKRLESVIDASGIGMMQLSREIEIRWFSGRIGTWFNWLPAKTANPCPLLNSPEGCSECVVAQTVRTGRPAEAERREQLPKGGERHFRHSSSPVRDSNGAVVQVVEVVEEVTSRKALEAEAVRTGKLSVLGRMAAGIAHEIGNPLSSISARLSLLEQQQDERFVGQSIHMLRDQVERISRIVHGVSHFARRRQADRSVWDLNPLIQDMVEIGRLDQRAGGIDFRCDLQQPSLMISGVRDQISQIILNLLLNAVESMPHGGSVTVSSQRLGSEARVTVEDEGPGLEEGALEHLFEPFFTTKADGTGLGLPISLGLASAHGGRIEVESQGGRGCRFMLFLPLAEEQCQSEAVGRAHGGFG
jgi:signal transduction histidine kinase